MIEFQQSQCSDLGSARSREWLETNGLGGFACSTIAGMNTRRYHGLLTVATHPPVGRVVLLSKLEETLVVGDRRMELSTNEYSGPYSRTIYPQGYKMFFGFRLDPFPISTFDCLGVRIEKSVFMVHDSNSTVVEYKVLAAPANVLLRLELRPLIAFRDYHGTTHENDSLDPAVQQAAGLVSVAPYSGLPRLYLANNASRVDTHGNWYRNFFYSLEAERGLDCTEDLYNPLRLDFEIGEARPAIVIASTEPQTISSAGPFRNDELARRRTILAASPVADPLARQLAVAAEQFVAKRGDGYTVMAGYPWFADWGRDTMIMLPGLLHLKGYAKIVKKILGEYSRYVDQGMLPNRFPDTGEAPEFNTVDATLWFFEAARAYLARTGDEAFIRDELYAVLQNILDWHMRGTRYHIRVQPDGLLQSGEPGSQLTWMDARANGHPVTPRIGKAVEIQALWFNALKTMEDFAGRFGDAASAEQYRAQASLAQQSFNRIFWNSEANCLYDVISDGRPDASMRPNQILAVSLHHSMLPPERAQQVVAAVARELLTPYGLRTLSPKDPGYRGRYEGDPSRRDSAYHQGTAWPWLLGPYITAFCKVHGFSEDARQQARQMLKPLESHLAEAGLGQISEVFDGDAPQLPRGCFAQAWSVGEILRVVCEDIYPSGPREAETGASTLQAGTRAASSASFTTSARASRAASFLFL